MAHPKRRHSNMRSRLRRTHDTLKLNSLSKCSNCGHTMMSHRICPKCGFYKGKQVITIKTKDKKNSDNS